MLFQKTNSISLLTLQSLDIYKRVKGKKPTVKKQIQAFP